MICLMTAATKDIIWLFIKHGFDYMGWFAEITKFIKSGLGKGIVNRWCWGRLVANKPPIYITKGPFWPLNLIFARSGSHEQHEFFLK